MGDWGTQAKIVLLGAACNAARKLSMTQDSLNPKPPDVWRLKKNYAKFLKGGHLGDDYMGY